MGSFNTFGRTEKSYGTGKNIWHHVENKFPVGGKVSNLASFPLNTVIPAGSMAIFDSVAGETKVLKGLEDFSTAKTYKVNDKVMHDGVAYKCSTAVSSAGAWTGDTNWTALAAGDTDYDDMAKVNGLLEDDIMVDEAAKSTNGAATARVVYKGLIYSSRLERQVPKMVWDNLTEIKQFKEA